MSSFWLSSFWAQPNSWPHDPLGYVFLARAVEEIGRSKFEDNWRGDETTAAAGRIMDADARRKAIKRLDTVQQEIVRQCEAGTLVCAYRPIEGGSMYAMPREWWSTEKWPQRFIICQLDPSAPFASGFAGEGYCWLFMMRESLDKYLRRFSPQQQSTGAAETAALRKLVQMLKTNPDLSVTQAQSAVSVGKNGFRRVWPKAREQAGLPPVAPSGRKRKSSR
jgi:hypothetical protein